MEGYSDFEGGANNQTENMIKGLISYQDNRFTLGFEAFQKRNRGAGIGGSNVVPFGISIFTWSKLSKTFNILARFDYYNPDLKDKTIGSTEHFWILGLDCQPINNIHVMPNVWINTYSPKLSFSTKFKSDIIYRVSFHYVFR